MIAHSWLKVVHPFTDGDSVSGLAYSWFHCSKIDKKVEAEARVETLLQIKPSLRLDCGHRCKYKPHCDGGSHGMRTIIVLPEGL